MEATPSLACANKCVFCWRHHKNPVGTSWKWEMDSSEEILDGIMSHHYKMVKELKGLFTVLGFVSTILTVILTSNEMTRSSQ